MKTGLLTFWCILLCCISKESSAQIRISNQGFSLGTTGRIGVGYSPNSGGHTGYQLNLNHQGSLSGRLDQSDYVDFLPAFHLTPKKGKDSTEIDFQQG